jgi:hypothetical protein
VTSRPTPRPTSRRSGISGDDRRPDEQGAGVVSAIGGVTVFFALLLVAVQLLFNLYATTVVTAVAFDAARVVAGADVGTGGDEGRAVAETSARRLLGRYARRVTFDWQQSDDNTVVLRVRADNPSFVVRAWAGSLGFDHIDRTVRVRVERVR